MMMRRPAREREKYFILEIPKITKERAQRSTLHSSNTFVISRSAFTELNSNLRFLHYIHIHVDRLLSSRSRSWKDDCMIVEHLDYWALLKHFSSCVLIFSCSSFLLFFPLLHSVTHSRKKHKLQLHEFIYLFFLCTIVLLLLQCLMLC